MFTNKSHGRLEGNSTFPITKLTASDAVHMTRNQLPHAVVIAPYCPLIFIPESLLPNIGCIGLG